MNLVQNLRHRAELQPGVPAIVDRTVRGDRVVSFVAFNRSVDFLALRLREEGVKSGHQVLLALDPSQEFYLFALALLQIGAIPIICRKALGSSFLTEWVKNVQPQACVIPLKRGLLTPTGRRHQIDKFKPNRVAAKAEFLNRYLRSSTSPLQKVFVLDAPLTSEDVEFFAACRQHGNIELLFGREAPLANCTFKAIQSRADY